MGPLMKGRFSRASLTVTEVQNRKETESGLGKVGTACPCVVTISLEPEVRLLLRICILVGFLLKGGCPCPIGVSLRLPQGQGGHQSDKDSSPNLSFNDPKQWEMEIEEGSARVSLSHGLRRSF